MSEEKREREVPSGASGSRRKRTDHPLLQFSRSVREFRGGLAELRRVTDKLGKVRETPSVLAIREKTRETAPRPGARRDLHSFAQPLRSNSAGKKQLTDVLTQHIGMRSKVGHARLPSGVAPRLSFIPPFRQAPGPAARELGWKNVYGPEDREAVKHLVERGSTGTFEDLPRAARVAMVMEADRVLNKEGRQDRVVGFLAAAARSGKPEIAANFNPRKLERMLGSLLGGRQAALQALWTPEVARLVERYQTERKTAQERLQTLEKVIPAELATRPGESRIHELPVPFSEPAIGTVPRPALTPSRSDHRVVEALFKRNDLLHLQMHGENRRRQLAERVGLTQERALPEASRSRTEMPLPTEGAPARRAGAMSRPETRQGRSDERRKLEGTLTLVSGNGETIGSAILNGSDRNG